MAAMEEAVGKLKESPLTWFLGIVIAMCVAGGINFARITDALDQGRLTQQKQQQQLDAMQNLLTNVTQAQAVQSQEARDQTAALDARLKLLEERKP